MADPAEELEPGDGLLVVDVQQCFCPGGDLPVPEGDRVVPVLNAWLAAATDKRIPVYASRDWHPPHHVSFVEMGGDWPPHCLQDTEGAAFHPDLDLPPQTVKISKGVRLDHDQNSAFDETGLAFRLRRDKVGRLWVGGLALDVCILASVLDGRREGFEMVLIEEATRPVDARAGRKALVRMREAGARIFAAETVGG
ncbi:MAG: isochorismatase family protein [Desulfobacteraceae bacterium]|nr:isochorismatase family protein [Desulfobacteraceae bacterium]